MLELGIRGAPRTVRAVRSLATMLSAVLALTLGAFPSRAAAQNLDRPMRDAWPATRSWDAAAEAETARS
jgi:hypothetical protein